MIKDGSIWDSLPIVSDLFGTIASTSAGRFPVKADFLPLDGNGKTLKIKGAARWRGLRNRVEQRRAYEFCFPVSTVIDRLAEADTTGRVWILRKKGKGADGEATSEWATKMRALMEQPNEMQCWEEFRGQQIVEKKMHGFVLVFPLMPAGHTDPADAYAMVNIPGDCVKPVSKRVYFSGKIANRIDHFEITILGGTTILQPEQVFILKDTFHQDREEDYLLPLSRLVGLDMAISNVCAAMEADNVLLRKKGPLGAISHDAAAVKDSQIGYLPMTKTEKKNLQGDLAQYGLSLSQWQYIISRTAIKYVPFSSNLSELRTSEKVVEGTKQICHRFNYSYVLYDQSDTTFANGDNASAMLYQTNVIPNANKDMNVYNKFFKAGDNNGYICMDFEDVPFLQEDAANEAAAALSWNQALEIEFNNNQITRDEWRIKRGWDPLPNGEGKKYFRDEQTAAPAVPPPIN